MRAILLAIVMGWAGLSCPPASAFVLIAGDNGGLMEEYIKRFSEIRKSGDTVIIDGDCMSACTMILGLVPRDRICVTDSAVLGFHAAYEYTSSGDRIRSASGTRDLMKSYPAAVRAWIVRQGGLTQTMMFLRGPALRAIVPPCGTIHPPQPPSGEQAVQAGSRPSADLRRASTAGR